MKLEGGCLCGTVRYRIEGEAIDAAYCHCSLCRRASGAPVVAWITFPVEDFAYVAGTPRVFHSSARGQREFCAQCGTQLVYRQRDGARTVDVSMASLDDPQARAPEYHIFVADRLGWFGIGDDLPRYDDAGPDTQ